MSIENGSMRAVDYLEPVLLVLQRLDGTGRPNEVKNAVARLLNLTEEEQAAAFANGDSRFGKAIDWARYYLTRAGYLDASERGVWRLTSKGWATQTLSEDDAQAILKQVAHQLEVEELREKLLALDARAFENGIVPLDSRAYRTTVLQIMRTLPPAGFERLCQHVLREHGFEQVEVTGRSGDGGIDGVGIVKFNPFITFKVLFQCKRYIGAVPAKEVRDLRGAVVGRADKGLLITTGGFTAAATAEAISTTVVPIELIDGEGLVDILEKLELGLIRRNSFDVDPQFFDKFR